MRAISVSWFPFPFPIISQQVSLIKAHTFLYIVVCRIIIAGHGDRADTSQRPRPSSFSVERGPQTQIHHTPSQLSQSRAQGLPSDLPPSQQYPSQGDSEGNGQNFQPYPMRQFPPPINGHTPPPPEQMPYGTGSGNFRPSVNGRVVSNPSSPIPSGNDDRNRGEFGDGPYNGMPKSQSMGPSQFNRDRGGGGGNIPETHPYRGFINAQQRSSWLGSSPTLAD